MRSYYRSQRAASTSRSVWSWISVELELQLARNFICTPLLVGANHMQQN